MSRTLLAFLLMAAPALAQDVLLFDGSLRAGEARPDDTYAFTFRLYAAAEGGAALWTEQHPLVDVVAGDFYVDLGSIEPLTPALFANGALYLALAVDGEPLGGREPLGTLPRAFFAIEAGGVTGQHIAPASVRVGGREVIDAQGNWVGPGGPGGDPGSVWPPADDMVRVPAGPFLMGNREGRLREVDLPAYSIDRLEVTVADYTRCIETGRCYEPRVWREPYTNVNGQYRCNWGKAFRGRHPMNCVTFEEAVAYCRAVNKQLPDQAQWEKAARGGCEIDGDPRCDPLMDTRNYPWGNALPDCEAGHFECPAPDHPDDYLVITRPVGGTEGGESPYGVRELSSSVAEHVHACIGEIGPDGPNFEDNRCVTVGEVGARGRSELVWQTGRASAEAMGFRCARWEE